MSSEATAAFPDDKDAGAEGRQLLRFRGKGEDANSVEGSLAKEFEDFLPGGRVDAAGRVVEHQHLGLQRKPLGEDRLLLVAAAELSKKGFGCRRPHVEEPYDPLDELELATWLQPEAREIRQQNVFRNGQSRNTTRAQTVGGQDDHSGLDERPWSCT